MLGERIGTLHGKVVGRRILSPVDNRPAFEATVELTGNLADLDVVMAGTYQAVVQAEGWFAATNPGTNVTTTTDGSTGVYHAAGTGRFTGPRSMKAGGLAYYTAATGSLAVLNGVNLVFDYEIKADDDVTLVMFEWI